MNKDGRTDEDGRMPLPTVASGGTSLGIRKPNNSTSPLNGRLQKKRGSA